jgi:hypothetical protein
MVWLRLNRAQFGLVFLSAALLVGGVAILLLPDPALPQPGTPEARDARTVVFEEPLPSIANDPAIALVASNPFDASRQPPAVRRTTTSAQTGEDENAGAAPASFVLLGTVVNARGRDIAVIQGGQEGPGGATYHVGEEPLPGFRVTRITRNGATITGNGQTIELEIQKAAQTGPGRFIPGARPAGLEGGNDDEDDQE